MRQLVVFTLLFGCLAALPAQADPGAAEAESNLYYSLENQLTMYRTADAEQPYLRLGFQEPVHLKRDNGSWCEVETESGATGYVECADISNVWIHVSKADQHVDVYAGAERLRRYPADFGYNAFADKRQRGSLSERDHWRTPEGEFHVVRKNPNSQYYKALVINYPTAEDAHRGLQEGLINQAEHDAIVEANERNEKPPMNTKLGGWIEIHGDGTGQQYNWTRGCVALTNDQMDEIWNWVDEGTPVYIE